MRNAIGSVGKVYLFLLLLLVPALGQTWNQPDPPPAATGPRTDDVKPRSASVDRWVHSGAPPAATGPRPDDVKPQSASAEHWLRSGAPPAAIGPNYYLSFGYSHLSMPIPGAVSTNLRGIDVSAGMDFRPRFGAVLDTNYAYTPNVLATKHQGYALTFLGGPVFYPFQHGSTRLSLHGLLGTGLIDGAAPISNTSYFYGWQSRFAYALGGAFEHTVAGPLAARLGADYLRSSFYDASGALQPQNNFRMTVGVVIHLNRHPARTVLR